MHSSQSDTTATSAAQTMLVQLTTDGVPKLHCPVCNKALVSLNGYVKHVKKHEPPGGFLCRYCEARFCSEDELRKHRDQEHTTIVCRICKELTFTSEIDYREHIRVVHNGIDREMYKCDQCGSEYKTLEPYRRHIETQCGTIKPHKCDQCDMSFVTKYNLKQHKDTHSGERKYCCSYCGKNFLQKGRLVEHERSHTGEKPYKCDVCGKCFAHRESIVTHSSIHTGVRLVECRCCHSRFSCYSNLIKHRRTRPDTCGLPMYDAPKNRKRKHRSRIPATLNPTSEIKVSSHNKIIKPKDKEKDKKTFNIKSAANIKLIQTSKTYIIQKKKSKITKKLKEERARNVTEEEDDPQLHFSTTKTKRTYMTRGKGNAIVTRFQKSKENNFYAIVEDDDDSNANSRNDDEEKDETFDFSSSFDNYEENVESDSNDNQLISPSTTPKSPTTKRLIPHVPIKEEHLEIELQDVNHPTKFLFTNDSALKMIHNDNVKPGEKEHIINNNVDDIFDERDKILRDLLNTNEDDDDEVSEKIEDESNSILNTTNDVQQIKAHVKLEQTEIILVDDYDVGNFGTLEEEEDVLDFIESSPKCRIRLKDITKRYPKLKQESTVEAKIKPLLEEIKNEPADSEDCEKPKKRKQRKRIEAKESVESTDETICESVKPKRLSQQQLKERLKMLNKEQHSWRCPHCVRVYHMRKPFEKHLREQHKASDEEIKNLINCDLEQAVANNEVFKCHICNKIYIIEKRLHDHVQRHGPNGNLTVKCPCYCSLYFASKEDATAHAQKEHREKLYCEICDKFCNGHDSLKNHMKHLHSDKEPARNNMQRNFVCDKCGKKFPGRTSLTDHVRSDCGLKPLYQCTMCGKHLTTAGILKTHMLLHSDETPYQCDKCGKTFKVKAQYKTHIKTRHTDYKPFKCHLCPKEYPYRESLLTHMTVHTGIKRFLCNGCGKRFTCISNLQAHRKVHADTCGLLPLNAKATQYMGVQKGHLLLGAKPEAGVDYKETNTLIAKEVIDRDMPLAHEIILPPDHTEALIAMPLKYTTNMEQSLGFDDGVAAIVTADQSSASSEMLHLPQMFSQLIEDDQNNFN